MRLDDLEGDRCLFCGTPLDDCRRADKVFCGRVCRDKQYTKELGEFRRQHRASLSCAWCGKSLGHTKSAWAKYCSDACRLDAGERERMAAGLRERRRVAKEADMAGATCQFCAGPLPANAKRGQKFCAPLCRSRWHRQALGDEVRLARNAAQAAMRKKRRADSLKDRTCAVCDVPLPVAWRKDRKFCSMSCYDKNRYRKRKAAFTCEKTG